MNEQQLITELRNSLQATVSIDELIDGQIKRSSKLVISDETQRATLAARLVELLKTVEVKTT